MIRICEQGEENPMAYSRILRTLVTSIAVLIAPVANGTELPAGVKTQPINDYPIAYVESGSGLPLVMVHGALSDYRTWTAQMTPMSQNHRAIAVSLRHYFPERWDGKGSTFSWQQHVADLIAFIKAIDAGPVHLLGHSRGGLIVVEAALAEPGLIGSLILAEPGVLLDEGGGFGTALQANADARTLAEQRAARTKTVLSRFEQADIDGGLQIFINDVGGPGSWESLTEAQRQMFRDNAWTVKGTAAEQRRPLSCREFGSLNKPVLLVGGEESPARYRQILNVIEPCLKQGKRVTIANASHGMHRMNPAEFNGAVIQFLRQRE
jgi:esterase